MKGKGADEMVLVGIFCFVKKFRKNGTTAFRVRRYICIPDTAVPFYL